MMTIKSVFSKKKNRQLIAIYRDFVPKTAKSSQNRRFSRDFDDMGIVDLRSMPNGITSENENPEALLFENINVTNNNRTRMILFFS